jgi:hypothetical protein
MRVQRPGTRKNRKPSRSFPTWSAQLRLQELVADMGDSLSGVEPVCRSLVWARGTRHGRMEPGDEEGFAYFRVPARQTRPRALLNGHATSRFPPLNDTRGRALPH